MLAVLLICYGDESINFCRKSTRPEFSEIQEKNNLVNKNISKYNY
jgi:hypothetical protein